MPPSATKRAKTRLSTMTTRLRSTVINSPASSGPKFATAMSRLKISIQGISRGPARPRPNRALRVELVEDQVAVAQPVFLQDGADLAVGAHLGERLGVGGAQRAILLAHGEARHAVAAAIDDVVRRRDGPQRLQIVALVRLGEFEIDEVVLEHRLQASLVGALHFVDLGLE